MALRWVVRNVGTKASGPISAMFVSCIPAGGCNHPPYSLTGTYLDSAASDFWLPDKFTLLGCAPNCAAKVVNDRTGWSVQWAGKVGPGKTANLTVRFRADGDPGYYYFGAMLHATSLATLTANLADAAKMSATKIGEWDDVQVVVRP